MSGLTYKEVEVSPGIVGFTCLGGLAQVKTAKTTLWPPAPDKILKLDGTVEYMDFLGRKCDAPEGVVYVES